ncbi:MAG: hypothetical protein QF872_07210 [Gammaproteobacteria bacterium]|nr:hypothetical protein [Gammaproteobacteria bacterium]
MEIASAPTSVIGVKMVLAMLSEAFSLAGPWANGTAAGAVDGGDDTQGQSPAAMVQII